MSHGVRQGPRETAEPAEAWRPKPGTGTGSLQPHSFGQSELQGQPKFQIWENKLSFEGMSCNVTLQRVWLQGHFCNRSTLGTLITNEASDPLPPTGVSVRIPPPFDVGTVDCGVRAGPGWALYLKCLWEDDGIGPTLRSPGGRAGSGHPMGILSLWLPSVTTDHFSHSHPVGQAEVPLQDTCH